MSENTNPSEEPYDATKDPDADPGMLDSQRPANQGENRRDKAEGDDDPAKTDPS